MKGLEELMNDELERLDELHQDKKKEKNITRLRDEFAMAAMNQIIGVAHMRGWQWESEEGFHETVAKKSYMAADAMIKAREVKS